MKLKDTDMLEVATPKLITKLLSNSTAKDLWLIAAENLTAIAYEDKNDIHRVAKNPKFAAQTDPMALATTLKRYIDLVLANWKDTSNDNSTNEMKASLPLFVEMSKYLPHVNPSDKYDMAFRGTSLGSDARAFVQRSSNAKEWKKVLIAGATYMVYVGPKKNQFTYKPHRDVQSWSVSKDAASEFGNYMIATPLDISFFFDPDFLSNYGYEHEKETIHFGKQPMKVALMVRYGEYLNNANFNTYDESYDYDSPLTEDILVSDEEGTLSIPM